MKQDEIAWALIDIKSELELSGLTENENVKNALMKIDSLANELDFNSILNSFKRIIYGKMKESSGTDREHFYNQYQLLKGATTFEELYRIVD